MPGFSTLNDQRPLHEKTELFLLSREEARKLLS